MKIKFEPYMKEEQEELLEPIYYIKHKKSNQIIVPEYNHVAVSGLQNPVKNYLIGVLNDIVKEYRACFLCNAQEAVVLKPEAVEKISKISAVCELYQIINGSFTAIEHTDYRFITKLFNIDVHQLFYDEYRSKIKPRFVLDKYAANKGINLTKCSDTISKSIMKDYEQYLKEVDNYHESLAKNFLVRFYDELINAGVITKSGTIKL